MQGKYAHCLESDGLEAADFPPLNPTGAWRRSCAGLWAIVLGAFLFLPACSRHPAVDPEEKTAEAAPDPDARTEERWMVESIVRDLASLAVFAADPKAAPLAKEAVSAVPTQPEGGASRYEISVRLPGKEAAFQTGLTIAGSIWAPASYAPVAKALLAALDVTAPEEPRIDGDPLAALTTLTATGIQAQNRRVSDWLTLHPLDPEAHEQAALVVGALGMRENSGSFWDTRGFCNRAAAHLAFARAIRGDSPVSESGEVGELLIGLFADTKRDSQQAIEKLRSRPGARKPELLSWARAAALRNTRDWREFKDEPSATLLEQIEYFRAVGEAISPEAAAKRLLSRKREDIPDWTRIIFQFGFSVGVGHTFADSAVLREVREEAAVFPELREGQFSPEKLVRILNQAPGGVVAPGTDGGSRVIVIDDGAWAHFFQRHLCHVIVRTDIFLRRKWGVPDQAGEFETAMAGAFGQLTFFPLVREIWAAGKPDAKSHAMATALVRSHPEWIPEGLWEDYLENGAPAPSLGVPTMAQWFSPGLPAGTAYSFYNRYHSLPKVKNMATAEFEKLYELAPWQYNVAQGYLYHRYRGKATPEQYREVMARFLDFKELAMREYGDKVAADPAQYGAILRKAAVLEPYNYLTLGDYYQERKMDDEAAAAYQAALDNEADAVAVANNAKWLVDYYYDRGKNDQALAVAKFAAEVYSYSGLEAMAGLMERMGDQERAEDYFSKIKERYEDAAPLLLFYQRQVAAKPGSPFAAKLESVMGAVFPTGMKEVKVGDFSGEPKGGVLIVNENRLLRKSGLSQGDIIVALDGRQTGNFEQYQFVRGMKASPEMELIVYKAGKYRLVKCSVPKRKFNLDFVTWPR